MRCRVDLLAGIEDLLRQDQAWEERVRACVDWTLQKRYEVMPEEFTRRTIYHRLGSADGDGPRLTPLEKAGVIRRRYTNATGTAVYELAADPERILDALERALASPAN